MIPQYPSWTPLAIDTKRSFDQHTTMYEPFAEFSFPCAFSWDTKNTASVSMLNNNLLLKMPDYITNEPFYSIIGTNDIDESLELLLDEVDELKLVPEVVIEKIKSPERFKIEEDRDQFDYVYLCEELAHLVGPKLKGRRNKSSLFLKTYYDSIDVKKLNLSSERDAIHVMDVFNMWSKTRHTDESSSEHERETIEKIIRFAEHFNFVTIGLFLHGRCIGFSINEIVQGGYAICRFQKTTFDVDHTDVFLTNLVAKELKHFECIYISWEQDLGIIGLRSFKESYGPVKFLKKYTVSLAEQN